MLRPVSPRKSPSAIPAPHVPSSTTRLRPLQRQAVKVACGLLALLVLDRTLAAQTPAPVLRWGGDAEGGAPFVEADPSDPQKRGGFDVEIAELIAQELGRTPQFVQVAFTSLDQSAERGDFDIGLSGIEDTPARRAAVAATIPVLRVPRSAHGPRSAIATLSLARRSARPARGDAGRHDRLRPAARRPSASTASSPCRTTMTCIRIRICCSAASTRCCSTTCWPIARCGATRGLFTQPDAVATGHYIVITAPENTGAARSGRTASCARRCATARSSGSSASGTSGTTTSRGSTRELAASRRPAVQDRAASRHSPPSTDRQRDAAAICRRCFAPQSSRWSCRAWRWRWRSRAGC